MRRKLPANVTAGPVLTRAEADETVRRNVGDRVLNHGRMVALWGRLEGVYVRILEAPADDHLLVMPYYNPRAQRVTTWRVPAWVLRSRGTLPFRGDPNLVPR